MVTVGLVREFTAEAARQAALGAGARLVGAFSQQLTAGDIAKLEDLAPDILLLAGGTDGGNSEVILHNARALAESAIACPVIVAGNRAVADALGSTLDAANKTATVTDNVMPEFGELNIEPARAAIRRVFIDRIVHAKGIDRANALFDQVLMPTPAAVMDGARLLSEGYGDAAGLGPLVERLRGLGVLLKELSGGSVPEDARATLAAASEIHAEMCIVVTPTLERLVEAQRART